MKAKAKDIILQGDIAFVRIDEIPDGLIEAKPRDGKYIVAHSETGHHHTVDEFGCRVFDAPKDSNVCYLLAENEITVLHERPWDTHAPAVLTPGKYIGIRQVEHAPEGWRRVAD